MIFFDSLKEYIQNFDRKDMIRWSGAYIGLCLVGMIGILIRHVMVNNEIQAKMIQLNKSRSQVQHVFTKYQAVLQQKNKVDAALKQDKGFNIQKFVQELLTQNNLTNQVTSRFSRQKLPNGYIEESLALNCTQITMQQLCELIFAVEKQPLAYILFVDITRMVHAKKINVNVSIATLRAEE